ncbi:MAG TPA: hypothetical protein PLE24_11300 [Chitinispirillaceae bacterium]|jgi:hypothetical protein|nr:hypothetical protein [Chitinispirillaceae bacterium]
MQEKKEKAGNESKVALKRKFYQTSWFYAILFVFVTAVIFHQFLFSDGMLHSSDQMSGFDAKVFLQNSLKEYKQFPMWFSSRLSGMPTIDAMFGDPFYLPSMIVGFLFPIHRAISIKMILHVLLAGLFFYLLLRRGFKFSRPLAFAGGLLYMLNPQFLSHIYPGHDGKMYVIAWLPFIIWRMKSLVEFPSLFNASLLSFGLGMSLLTSHVQMNYFMMWGLFLFWLFAAVLCLIPSQRNVKKAVMLTIYFWGSVAFSLLLAIAPFLPSYLYVREAFSVRGVDRGFEFAASWALGWAEVLSLWVPELVNTLDYYWGQNPFKLNSEYAGGITLLLAVLAIVIKPGKWRIFWGAVAVLSCLFALGANTPVFHIAYALIPGVKKFRAASMIMYWFSFGTVLLAALFLRDLIAGKLSNLTEEKQKRWTKGLFFASGVFVLITLLFSSKGFVSGLFQNQLDSNKQRIFELNFTRNFVPFLWLWLFFAVSTLLMLVAVLKNKLKPAAAAVIIVLFGLIDIYRVDVKFIRMVDVKPYFRSEPALEKLGTEMKTAPFRVFSLPGAMMSQQNGEGIFGLEGVSGFHDNELRWYREFRGDQQDRNFFSGIIGFNQDGQAFLRADRLTEGNPFLDIANVKYLLVRSQGQLMPFENRNALGRVSFAPGYTVMDSSAIIDALMAGTYDYRKNVALMEEPEVKPAVDSADQSLFSAKWEKYSPNHRVVKINAPSQGFLRISEIFYPGWEVRVDGKKVKVYRADLAWMAVNVDKGEHVVEMYAHSIYLGKVLWVSVAVAIVLCLYWLLYFIVLKKEKRTLLSGSKDCQDTVAVKQNSGEVSR